MGDCRTAALVSRTGSVDWWCAPRFDAASVFGDVLDVERGGRFHVAPAGGGEGAARYVPETNVLETTFPTPGGTLRVTDFMPYPWVGPPRILRLAECVEGAVEVAVAFAPRFDYGQRMPEARPIPGGVVAATEEEGVVLHATHPLTPVDGGATATARLAQGNAMVLDAAYWGNPDEAPPAPVATPRRVQAATEAAWRAWVGDNGYHGPYRDAVVRSALVLKALTYAPTGAVVAAPTTSLPEELGGVRNWDYRFSWVRDAAFSVGALHALGHEEEAARFVDWLLDAAGPEPAELRILYGITGAQEAPERELSHLRGYRGSAPVRVGNAAWAQRQLDVYGELADCAHRVGSLAPRHWAYFAGLADWVADHWREPDSGIWEVRSEPRHFVLSKAMAWVALERAARAGEAMGAEARAARWRSEARLCREEALHRGWDPALGAFRQAYETPTLDAANLLLPLVGFIDARDPRMVATVDATLERLVSQGLVYRYLGADDGLPGSEGAFAYCTFWLVECLALQGRVKLAREVFEGMLARGSHLGLFAEEVDPATGDHLGNFPQAFPHIGLINAALRLDAGAPNMGTP